MIHHADSVSCLQPFVKYIITDWMNRSEPTQAIPPCYTNYIGHSWLQNRPDP